MSVDEIIKQVEEDIVLCGGEGGWVEMGGPGSGHWRHAGRKGKQGGSAPGKGRRRIPENLANLKIDTYIDHGPKGMWKGKPLYTPGKNTITRVDKNALVYLDDLVDPKRVDIVRQVDRETSRRPGYIRELAKDIEIHGFNPGEYITIAVEQAGKITIIDGTHRIAAARVTGLGVIPAEVRYFGLSDIDYKLDYAN